MTAADLRVVAWPVGASLPISLSSKACTGSVTTAAISAGEPLTSSRVRTGRTWPGVRDGDVVVSVPVGDPTIARLVGAGDRVDVLGADASLGSDLPVLMVTTTAKGSDGGTGAVWVSAPGVVATRIAVATAGARTAGTQLSIVIRPAG